MKRLLLIIFAILLTLSPAQGEFFKDVILSSPTGIWTDSRAYTTLNAAVTAIGATEQDLYIAKEEVVTTLVIPANIRLRFVKDGAIANSNTLTINTKNIHADHQIFTGAGAVNFVSSTEVRTRWFVDFETAITQTSNDTVTLTVDTADTLANSAAVGDNVLLKWNASNLITIAAGQTLSNIGDISAPSVRLFVISGAITFRTSSSIQEINANWFGSSLATLGLADTAAAAAGKSLTFSGPWVIDTDLTLSSNLKALSGTDLQIATTKTLTINGAFGAGFNQIFSCTGTGKVVFGVGAVKEVYPEWWASNIVPGTTDMQPALQAALASLSAGGTVQLQKTTYCLTTAPAIVGGYAAISWPDVGGITLAGQGKGATKILCNFGHATTVYTGILADSATTLQGLTIRGLTIYGPDDIPAVPAHLIELQDNIYDAVIDNVECYYSRISGIRHSSTFPGARSTISNNYLHDIMTATMGTNVAGGAILGAYPQNKVIGNVINDCGNGTQSHGIYTIANDLIISKNQLSGTYSDIHVYNAAAGYANNILVEGNTCRDTGIIAWAVNGLTVANNTIYDSRLSVGYDCIGYTISGNTIYSAAYDVTNGYVDFGGSYGTINGNTIYGSGTVGSSSAFMTGNQAADHILISGNTAKACSYGLRPLLALTNSEVKGNTFVGTGSATASYCFYNGSSDTANVSFNNNNSVEGYAYLFYSSAKNAVNIEINGNKLKDVLRILSLYNVTDPFGPLTADNNMAVDTTLVESYAAAYPPTATKKASVLNTWRLPDGQTATLANSATPSIQLGKQFLTGGTTAITNFTGGSIGQTITILAKHTVTITHGTPIQLTSGANFGMVSGDTLTLHMYELGVWQEVSRKH